MPLLNPMMDFDLLVYRINEWQEATFTKSTRESIIAHLTKEVTQELKGAPGDEEELADCFLLLLHLAWKNGLNWSDIVFAIEDKFEKNRKRNWGEPNDEGFVEHIDG